MGWDAQTNLKADYVNEILVSKRYNKLFQQAYKTAKNKLKNVNELSYIVYLKTAHLNGWNCNTVLSKAVNHLGFYCTNDNKHKWTAEEVKYICENANWKFRPKEEREKCAYWTSRLFLETCAKAGIGISFSW